ncbi:MAG: hypothetical protein KDA84_23440, partial [Planctomycetaceae bacterium]|nr:hypothetical protein [Planctomycetaceae bacterium]
SMWRRFTHSCKTEFHGVPTPTCLAIGPAGADKIDEITGKLQLLWSLALPTTIVCGPIHRDGTLTKRLCCWGSIFQGCRRIE